MRTTILKNCITLSLALAACGGDTTGTGTNSATDSTGTTADPTGDPDTTATSTDPGPTTSGDDVSASGTETTTTTTVSTSESSTTAPDDTTTTTSTPGTTTTGDESTTGDEASDTGVMLGCGFDGPQLDAVLVHDGFPPPPCGTFEFTGQNIVMDAGPVYHLDGCPCDNDCFAPDPWTFTLDVPFDALPAVMPICPRIVVERQMSKAGCELVGVTIDELQNKDWPLPYYVAGSLLGPPEAADDLALTQDSVEVCACDGCCSPPERYDLEFEIMGESLVLAEDEMGVLGDPNDRHYAVKNYQSHLSGICDDSPAIDWVVNLQPAP
jgi:hypothetical protein